MGETGSGKTTLVQHFNGLLKPSAGKVYVLGRDLSQAGILWPDLRRSVGLVFQSPEQQLFEETVFEDISFVLRRQKSLSPEEIERRVRSALLLVGLDAEEFSRRSPFELSGGEMRRIALAGDPAVLILDEPTVGLDGAGKREILREISVLRRSGKTVIIVSHAVEEIVDLVDRLVVMEAGKVLTSGPPSGVFSFLLGNQKLTFLVPPIFRLFYDLRQNGWAVPGEIYKVEEAVRAIQGHLERVPFPSSAEN